MKKSWSLLGAMALVIIVEIVLILRDEDIVQFTLDNKNDLALFVQCGNDKINIYPYYNEKSGITYFFLPAFIDKKEILFIQGEIEELSINKALLSTKEKFVWEDDVVYSLTYNERNMEVQFMKSENLPTIFFETESGNLDYLDLNKNNSESGYVKVVQNSGNVEYKGELKKISERGHSTFGVRKKSFSFTLEDKYPLCGLDSGKKWNLLSLFYEQNKIQSKIIYDMAKFLGMEYATGSTWVDVYINGNLGGYIC